MKNLTKFMVLMLILLVSIIYSRSEILKSNSGFDQIKSVPVLENRVHRTGLFWMNVTNSGYFGNPDFLVDPCTGTTAVSGELPGGSGTGILFVGSLMFGGYLDSAEVNVGGTVARIFQGPLCTTGYEGWTGESGASDMPRELWPVEFDDDPSGALFGRIVESSNVEGRINCLSENVYDPMATAEEQFSMMYTDKFVQRTPYTGMDDYDERDHIPLGIEVRQKSYSWSYDYAKKFIIIDYTIYNMNTEFKDIYDFFTGMYVDCDIGMTYGEWTFNHSDDIGGFIQKWDNYIDPASGEQRIVDMNLAWAADNDGRNYTGTNYYTATGEPGAGSPLDGATSIAAVKVLRNPNPNLRYSFNMYAPNSEDESYDWGPRWKTGLHSDWQYDLTPFQKGYDDTNQDNLTVSGNEGTDLLYGGRTEGRPAGDRGKYMVMSNDEFDYEQYKLRYLRLGLLEDPDYMFGTPYAQADKWQQWTTSAEAGLPGFGEVADGEIPLLNDIANGSDVKFMLSFGPLGTETTDNIATDTDFDGIIDDYIPNKKVWKFAYGDSLKMTIAFIVSENFHTSLDQDPNYANNTVIDLNDGLDESLFERGWYDALYNTLWAERIYDTPMFDTPVTFNGLTKSDGWYGEDVGTDGLFGEQLCWWYDQEYTGPDQGEGDFNLTAFSETALDINGNLASNEDELLPYGRIAETGDYGTTQQYGCMERYAKADGVIPAGTWVRYGYGNSRLDAGDGVPDFTGPLPPPSPKISLTAEGSDIIISWKSHEIYSLGDGTESYKGSEHVVDRLSRLKDFESYSVMVSPDNNPHNFTEIFTADMIDYVYEDVGEAGKYLDVPFSQDVYDSLTAAGESTIVHDGRIWALCPYGDNNSLTQDHIYEGIYEYRAVPESVIINGDSVQTWNYSFRLINGRSGEYRENSYVAVVASDFGYPRNGVSGLTSSPSSNMLDVSSGISEDSILPYETFLYQNYPNPFNPETTISFTLRNKSFVELVLYNCTGQMVIKLAEGEMDKGFHQVNLKAYDMNSGVYFCTLKAGGREFTRKLVMVK